MSLLSCFVERYSKLIRGMHKMAETVIPDDAISKLTVREIIEKIQLITFDHKASTPSDDDEYWLCQSPFDGKWYLFASLAMGGGWPEEPVSVTVDRPSSFDE